ncbi:hypothetical protein ABIA31_008752 [Catenulispora sp. MAP5-51]
MADLLLIAGHETTANVIPLGTLALLRHPDQLALVHDDPSAVEDAVEELLRRFPGLRLADPAARPAFKRRALIYGLRSRFITVTILRGTSVDHRRTIRRRATGRGRLS